GLALAEALGDRDGMVRESAARALEEMGYGHQRLVRRWRSLVEAEADENAGKDKPPSTQLPPGLLLEGVEPAAAALARAVHDRDVGVQLAAIDALDGASHLARHAVPALAEVLGSRDRFVRWSAARVLGRIDPVEGAGAVAGLVRLLDDVDLDVRRAAT